MVHVCFQKPEVIVSQPRTDRETSPKLGMHVDFDPVTKNETGSKIAMLRPLF